MRLNSVLHLVDPIIEKCGRGNDSERDVQPCGQLNYFSICSIQDRLKLRYFNILAHLRWKTIIALLPDQISMGFVRGATMLENCARAST
jgi:hypothetical protein